MDGHVPTIMDEGWTVVDNGDSGRPSWSYTVGLWHHQGWPELVICGMDSDWRATLLGQAVLAMEHKQGWSGDVDLELGLLFIKLTEVDPGWGATRLLEQSAAFYRSDVPPHCQLVWTDADGNFPGDNGFDEKLLEAQPDLAVPWPDHRPGVWPRLGHRP
ncbi:DUF4262 domain-containing protein [Actinomadura scrupuli]|uniref:DUF4262 domain-containing protein n=1 Tax=Actinomadura scrupuli TaxID=559629 RepID=UPI003D97B75E